MLRPEKPNECQSQQAGGDQCDGEALEALGALSLVDALTDGSEQDDSQSEAQAAGSTVDSAQQEVVAFLNVYQNNTQNGAVGGDQGQEHAQSLVQSGDKLLQEHFHNLNQGGNDQNEGNGLHVLQVQCHQNQVNTIANGRSQGHNEGNSHAHAQSGIDLLGNAHEGADTVELHQNKVLAQKGSNQDAQNFSHHYFAASFILFFFSR